MAYTTIDDPSVYFQTTIYTGDASTQDITNSGNSDLQPDWIWIKNRDAESNHIAQDTSRGINVCFFPDDAAVEQTNSNFGHVNSVASDGFQVDEGNSGEANANKNTEKYVAWQWKANGGTTASNTDGNLTTTVQANQTAGFSIVLWTSTGSSDTIGHGLGATPQVLIEKSRSTDGAWTIFTSMGGNKLFAFTDADATTSFSGVSNVGSSIFTDGNGGTDTRLVYCFTPIQGYSKFGNYVGTGNADGPFLYTGFKPAWVMIKETGASGSWHMFDNTRKVGNVSDSILYADLNNAEATSQTGNPIDILSNGFKCRGGGNDTNLDDGTYIYMAFAESPFVSSEGVPTTAV